MSQEYTPVTWQDETTSTQGTLITAERMNTMQEAHHYADGFKEVDSVPTADPGVDYHQVVYCTADSTFYRWDGSQWAADIDDDTKALLQQEITRATQRENEIAGDLSTEVTARTNADTALGTRITNEATARGNADDAINLAVSAHVGDHSNPHEVTKAQVGLGNCDNTSDADKPVSTAVQSALDTKASASDLTTLAGRVTGTEGSITTLQGKVGTLESADGQNVKLTGAQTIAGAKTFSDAITAAAGLVGNVTGSLIGNADTATRATSAASADSATSAGTASTLGSSSVGSDTKPIKLVNGTATAVANDLVDTATPQTIGEAKTWTGAHTISSTLAVSGAVTMASTLAVTGATTLAATTASSLAVNGAVAITGGSNPSITKTFPNINNYDAGVQRGDNHAAAMYRGVFYFDKNGKPLHTFGGVVGPNNMVGTFLSVYRNQEEDLQTVLGLFDDGTNRYATAPTPAADAPTGALVTEAWCADTGGQLNNLAHRNGAETIDGVKTFTSYIMRYDGSTSAVGTVTKMTNLDYSWTGSSIRDFRPIRLIDINDHECFRLQYRRQGKAHNFYATFTLTDGTEQTVTLASFTES